MSDPSISEAVTKIETGIKTHQQNLENLKGELNSRREKLNYMALEAQNDNIRFLANKLEQELQLKSQALGEATKEIQKLSSVVRNLQAQKDESDRNLQDTSQKLSEIDKMKIAISESENALSAKEVQINKLSSALKQSQEKNKQLLQKEKEQAAELISLRKKVQETITDKNEWAKQNQAATKKLNETILDLRIKNEEHEKANLKAQQQITEVSQVHAKELEDRIEELRSVAAAKDAEILQSRTSLEAIEKNNQSLLRALEKAEKTCGDLQVTVVYLRTRCTEIEARLTDLSSHNQSLIGDIRKLREELDDRLQEIEHLKFELTRIIAEELITLKISVIDPPAIENKAESELKVRIAGLEKALQESESAIKAAWLEKKQLRDNIDSLNEELKNARKSATVEIGALKQQLGTIQEDATVKKLQNQGLIQKVAALESSLVERTYQLEETQANLAEIQDHNKDHIEELGRLKSQLEESREICETIEQEREGLIREKIELEGRLKQYKSRMEDMMAQLGSNTQELQTKEKEVFTLSKQLDSTKRKLVLNAAQLKKIASEQLQTQQKKIHDYESQVNILKDMVKGVQNEVKNKQREINRLKMSSPSPKSTKKPTQNPSKQQIQPSFLEDTKPRLPGGLQVIYESPPRQSGYPNIFKAGSPLKPEQKLRENKMGVLQQLVKHYLTSFVICHKNNDDLFKKMKKLDLQNTGLVPISAIKPLCKEAGVDPLLLNENSPLVDYHQLAEEAHASEVEHLHRELDKGFLQLTPGSVSISQLHLMKQGMKQVHSQIWGVIVESIQQECPFEVEFSVIKHKLVQLNITL